MYVNYRRTSRHNRFIKKGVLKQESKPIESPNEDSGKALIFVEIV